jgi:2-polyprenyl-3-methyl-5-hydroxy-6-metoxy-1,4-benzoquinol methylase
VRADFRRRETALAELMDDPAADLSRLHRTYRHFVLLNRLVSRWDAVYRRLLRPRIARGETATLLDVGCGGGDIPRRLAALARRDGRTLEVLAIDSDPRAIDHAARHPAPGVRYARAALEDLDAEPGFDFVISNNLLHHLPDEAVRELADRAVRLARRAAVFNDIARSAAASMLFAMTATPFLRRSFAATDGLRSIRRSYRAGELSRVLPRGWRVLRWFPWRLVGVHIP